MLEHNLERYYRRYRSIDDIKNILNTFVVMNWLICVYFFQYSLWFSKSEKHFMDTRSIVGFSTCHDRNQIITT